jgi:glutathione S-transferase
VLFRSGLKPAVNDPRFPHYLQWFHYCEGMVMPPVNTVVVHTLLLPEERRDATVLGQAQRLLTKALEPVNETLAGKDYLIGDLSGADIMLGHACFMANRIGSVSDEMTHLKAYVARIAARPAFQKAITMA